MQIITAKSWNNTEYYYNWAANDFIPFEQADLDNGGFHCGEGNMPEAIETAHLQHLKNVRLDDYYQGSDEYRN